MNRDGSQRCCVYLGDELAAYGFGDDHPFGPLRHRSFADALHAQQLDDRVAIHPPVAASRDTIELFHTPAYVDRVVAMSASGAGYLDGGDTPAFAGMYEAACHVAGSVCDAADRIMAAEHQHAFIPIAGLHHARRDSAAGFCVFNDCGVLIEHLRAVHGLRRIAYVDIDAHHGDGVFYSFDDDPGLVFLDFHEDGRYLYPGTGDITETGTGDAAGTKMNVPMPPHATDELLLRLWPQAENFLRGFDIEFILLQCGADSIDGDPITHMQYSEQAHAHVAQRLALLADEVCDGRLIAMGGGGYNHANLAKAWTAVVDMLA